MNSTEFKSTTPRLRNAIAAAILLGAGGAASADQVNLSLQYSCPFPLIGTHTITANVASDMPAEMGLGVETGSFPINVDTSVPNDARVGLKLVQSASIEGTAITTNTVHLSNGSSIQLQVPLNVPKSPIPDTAGQFFVPASGVTPADLVLNVAGPASIAVGALQLNMIARTANGAIAPMPIGQFTSNCTQPTGQANTLHTFAVVEGASEPEPVPADIEVAAEAAGVNFGNVQFGTTRQQTVTVANAGGENLLVNNVTITGANAASFSASSSCSTVAPGASCDITVTFIAEGEGTKNAVLAIASNDADEPTIQVGLTGSITEQPLAQIDVQESANFGETLLGTPTAQTITISNTGDAALDVKSVTVAGANAGDFTANSNCSIVAAGASCNVTVNFAPAAEGARSAQLTIVSNDGKDDSTTTVALSGIGKVEVVIPDPVDPDPVDPTPVDPILIDIAFDLAGLTQVGPKGNELSLVGRIDSKLDLLSGNFTADLVLNNTTAHIPVIQRFLNATAHVEFVSVGEATGSLVDGKLTANSKTLIKLPKVTVKMFGLDVKIGGGDKCQTSQVVSINLESPAGENFGPASGGNVEGIYDLPKLANCGLLTSVLSSFMAGPNNPIALTLSPAQ